MNNIQFEGESTGLGIYNLIKDLFPICRSITGNGVRETLKKIREIIPLDIYEVPSGTEVFDWTVPKEWNIRDAYIKDPGGKKIIDFKESNLHILNYSIPINKNMTLDELKQHLFYLPDYPDWIPYKTSYYEENWGFCLSYKQFLSLDHGTYQVYIDSNLNDGHLTYGEFFIPGKSQNEVIFSTHVCHPSLANDNLSGVCTAVFLAKYLKDINPKYSYRFLFIPGTIGAITWLYLNRKTVKNIKHGLVLTGIGDSGKITYKKSRQDNAEIDKVAQYVLRSSGREHNIVEFSPYGYDERQYCSPGFNLPFGRLSRTPYGEYPQYHTSADNLDFISVEALGDCFSVILEILKVLEKNGVYKNLYPMCEPQLGKRGLYDHIGPNQLAILWVLSYADGTYSLLDICERSGISFHSIQKAAEVLIKFCLVEECML